MSYAIGDRILGRWQVLDIKGGRGRSGMGIVYVVNDRLTGETLAAKTFQPHLVGKQGIRESLHNEAELWLGMGVHPNVVTLRFVEPADDRLFLFMEYVRPDHRKRATLKNYLGAPLEEEHIGRWAAEICRGMIYAAEHGVICHLDLKPDNIMITAEGHAKITGLELRRNLSVGEATAVPAPRMLKSHLPHCKRSLPIQTPLIHPPASSGSKSKYLMRVR